MNSEIKQKWVAALRSGEFQQTRGNLCGDGKYCCLGVLCELACRDGIISRRDINGWTYYDGDGLVLPKSVVKWAGLEKKDPVVDGPCGDYSLSKLNDGGSTFEQIADIIEAKL